MDKETDRDARRERFASILSESGVLLAILPIVDQLLRPYGFDWATVGLTAMVAMSLLIFSVYLSRGTK
jgi:hypothetical protein